MTWIAVLVVSSVLLCPLSGVAQESRWEELSAAGVKAYEARDFGEAERRFAEALAESERATPDHWRLVISLQISRRWRGREGRMAMRKRCIGVPSRSARRCAVPTRRLSRR